MNNLINNFFGKKQIDELSISDLEDFFSTPQHETSTIEFKSGAGLLEKDVFKEITAFLNTEGGILILGAPQEKQDPLTDEKACFGELIATPFKSSLWLSQKIYSNITPPPTGIKIKELVFKEGKIFVLHIPQSYNPPHQYNSEGRYYIRIDTEAKPAPHGFVSALFQKRQLPKLESKISLINNTSVSIGLTNDSFYPAENVQGMITVINAFPLQGSEENLMPMRKDYDNLFGNHFVGNFKSDGVLVSIISFPISFEIKNQENPFIVIISYWSKTNDFDCDIFTLDPRTGENEKYQLGDENMSIEDLILKIRNSNL